MQMSCANNRALNALSARCSKNIVARFIHSLFFGKRTALRGALLSCVEAYSCFPGSCPVRGGLSAVFAVGWGGCGWRRARNRRVAVLTGRAGREIVRQVEIEITTNRG